MSPKEFRIRLDMEIKMKFYLTVQSAVQAAKQSFINDHTYSNFETVESELRGKRFGDIGQFNLAVRDDDGIEEYSAEFLQNETCWTERYVTYASNNDAREIFNCAEDELKLNKLVDADRVK